MIGFYYGSRESRRIAELREYKKAFVILKSEIEFHRSTLEEALLNVSEKVRKPVRDVFFGVSKSLLSLYDSDVYNMWFTNVLENKKISFLAKEDIEVILSFGKCLGYLDKQMQINNIDFAINYIEQKIEEVTPASVNNKKMFNSLGILSGILFCIIFF